MNDLNKNLNDLTTMVKEDVTNTNRVADISSRAKQNAEKGGSDMKLMLASIGGIKESSQNISKIILSNSAAIQESASVLDQLTNHAQSLKNMIVAV